MKPIRAAIALLGGILSGGWAAAQAQSPSLLSISSDPLLVSTLYRSPKNMINGVAADGAISVNAEWEADPAKKWFIEQQRYGADLIQMGLALANDRMIDDGIRVINWGFQHEGGGDFPGTGDPHHSISFFLEAAARSVILLREAGDERHLSRLQNWKRNLRNAAERFITPDVFPRDRSKVMDPYTHRFYLCAAGLGEAGSVLNDERLKMAALEMARAGLQLQEPDGTNPEKGGFDVNYQVVGAVFAIRYSLVCEDPSVRAQVGQMITVALNREKAAIGPDGSVDTGGSTRITNEESRSGRAKTMDYKMLAQGLVFWSDLSGEASDRDVAAAVARNRKW
jgi:hypothetical protein